MVSLTNALVVVSLAAASHGLTVPFLSHDEGQTESICNTDESQNALCYKDSEPIKFAKSTAVARLRVGGLWCTGWLFGSEGHMLTNNHCIPNDQVAAQTRVDFTAVAPRCDEPVFRGSHTGAYVASNVTLIWSDVKLDFALIKPNLLDGVDLKPYGYLQAS